MSNHWHYEHEGQQVGPFQLEELQQLAKVGMIHPDTVLLHENGSRIPASDLLNFDVGKSVPSPHVEDAVPTTQPVEGPASRSPIAYPAMPPPPPDAPGAVPPPRPSETVQPFSGAVQATQPLKFGNAVAFAFYALVGFGIGGKVFYKMTGASEGPNSFMVLLMGVVVLGAAIWGFAQQNFFAPPGEPRMDCPKCGARFSPRANCPSCGQSLTQQ